MAEIAIVHVCPHCERVFSSPSFCVEGQCETEPRPQLVPNQMFRQMQEDERGDR